MLKGVNFQTGSAKLRPESTATLDALAPKIEQCHCSEVDIRGYTDSTGASAFNHKLSEQRATAVKDYLESHGAPTGILTAKGFGEENPDRGQQDPRRVGPRIAA